MNNSAFFGDPKCKILCLNDRLLDQGSTGVASVFRKANIPQTVCGIWWALVPKSDISPASYCKELKFWARKFLESIPVGADFDRLPWQLTVEILQRKARWLDKSERLKFGSLSESVADATLLRKVADGLSTYHSTLLAEWDSKSRLKTLNQINRSTLLLEQKHVGSKFDRLLKVLRVCMKLCASSRQDIEEKAVGAVCLVGVVKRLTPGDNFHIPYLQLMHKLAKDLSKANIAEGTEPDFSESKRDDQQVQPIADKELADLTYLYACLGRVSGRALEEGEAELLHNSMFGLIRRLRAEQKLSSDLSKLLNPSELMHFDPVTGKSMDYQLVVNYRIDNEGQAWLYNPWTGRARHPRDIFSDPGGLGCVYRSEPLQTCTEAFTAGCDLALKMRANS